MKVFRLFLSVVALLGTQSIWAQSTPQKVNDIEITKTYRSAVHDGVYKELNSSYGLDTGYHGMTSFSYVQGLSDYNFGRFEFSTTHGYQFNPYLFLGGGLALDIMPKYYNLSKCSYERSRYVDIPIYANVRCTFFDGPIVPFVSVRGGYFLTHHGGLYSNASAGCRFAINEGNAINVSVGYSLQNLRFADTNTHVYKNQNANGLSFTIGYEF